MKFWTKNQNLRRKFNCNQKKNMRKKSKFQSVINEKVALLKKLKEDFERELAKNSNKSSNADLFSTDALSYDSDKITWHNLE